MMGQLVVAVSGCGTRTCGEIIKFKVKLYDREGRCVGIHLNSFSGKSSTEFKTTVPIDGNYSSIRLISEDTRVHLVDFTND